MLDKVGHGGGRSCVHMVPAERLPDLREVRDIMFSWIRPVAVLTSQFFLSDEKGEMDMPSRINGGRASLQQEVDFDSVYSCPQKGRRATGTHRLETVSPPQQTTAKLDTVRSNGLHDLDRKYKLKLCDMMVQSRVEAPRTGPEMSSYPRLESHEGRIQMIDGGADMRTLIGSKKIRTGRSVGKFPELEPRARITAHIKRGSR